MYERMKTFLYHFFNVVVALIGIAAFGAYLGISSILISNVINDLRLDTYIGVDTGFGIVLTLFFMVWVPLHFILRLRD